MRNVGSLVAAEQNKIPLNETSKAPATASAFKFGGDLPKPQEKPATSTYSFSSLPSKPVAEVKQVEVTKQPTFSFGSSSSKEPEPKPAFSFGSSNTEKKDPPTTAGTGFSFGKTPTPAASTVPSIFGSGLGGAGGAAKPFSFGTATPFSFGNVTQAPKDEGDTKPDNEEDDDDKPKVNEFTPVVEEDSVYSKRCKVFVKQGNEYKERGVGTLFIKPVEEGTKTQVIVRADTNLGNLLLNTLLTESVPLKRMGKNNVMIAAAIDGKPATVLLRVKATEDADELLTELEKNKK